MDIWVCDGDSVQRYVDHAVANWHPDLALCEFITVMRDKASKSGGVEIPGKVRKASALLRAVAQVHKSKPYDYVLEIAGDLWMEYGEEQRLALIDHLLCHCVVEELEDGVAYKIQKPNIQMFSHEIARHGMWRPVGDEDDNDLSTKVTHALEESQSVLDRVEVTSPEDVPENLVDESAVDDLLA